MLLAVELRRSDTSLGKHRRINPTRELRRSGTSLFFLFPPPNFVSIAAHRYLFCYHHPIAFLFLFLLLLFHPPGGGLVVRWRITVVFYCCSTRLKAGYNHHPKYIPFLLLFHAPIPVFLLAMLMVVELRRSGTSLAKHRRINPTRELRRSGTSLAKIFLLGVYFLAS